jgi:hypothetical protein
LREWLAACCASAQNRIKIHASEFLYFPDSNCISSSDNRDFLNIYSKKPQVQQAAKERDILHVEDMAYAATVS